ncbi:hypothetical protein ACFL09_01085 [Planctomycetota bacterium]
MKCHTRLLATGLLALLAVGCSGIRVSDSGGERRKGLRIYDPAYYVVVTKQTGKKNVKQADGTEVGVDVEEFKTDTFIGPDLESYYEVAPYSLFAKSEFTVKLADGLLTEATENLDTTALLDFIKQMAQMAADAQKTGTGTSGTPTMDGQPFTEGIYIWRGGTKFVKITP